MLTDLDSRDPLHWLGQILWPDQSTSICVDGPAAPRWWASPDTTKPRVLIPAGSAAAARTAVRRYHDGFDTKLRLRSAAAELVAPFSEVFAVPLRRKQVAVHHQVTASASGVLEGIVDILGIDDLHVAVSLSTPKSNQKPVLQLLDGSGRCHGWAKVAWNSRTEALVANESRWLEKTAIAPLSKPSLLHDVNIAGRRVVISSSVTPSRFPRRRITTPPGPQLFKAVSALGTTEMARIKDSKWWHSVEQVLDQATSRERLAIQGAVDSCYRHEVRLGAWHGDLTPWNLMTTSGGTHLIDWEFAADGAPLGFDLCHFHTQVGSEMRGLDAGDAIGLSARLSPHGLAALGIEPETRTIVWRMYLVELIRRMLTLRANGYPSDQITHGPAALRRLERSQGAIRSSIRPAAPAQNATSVEQEDTAVPEPPKLPRPQSPMTFADLIAVAPDTIPQAAANTDQPALTEPDKHPNQETVFGNGGDTP